MPDPDDEKAASQVAPDTPDNEPEPPRDSKGRDLHSAEGLAESQQDPSDSHDTD